MEALPPALLDPFTLLLRYHGTECEQDLGDMVVSGHRWPGRFAVLFPLLVFAFPVERTCCPLTYLCSQFNHT